jgi:hypothetical protein
MKTVCPARVGRIVNYRNRDKVSKGRKPLL